MFSKEYQNYKINYDSKVLIAVGDSFAEGQGAVSWGTWAKYGWDQTEMIRNRMNYLEEERSNSFVAQLSRYFLPSWTPVNLGKRGTGNRSAAQQLFLHPELNLEVARKKIVIFMLSGLERFDFINRELPENHSHFAMWPHKDAEGATHPELWNIYADQLYNEKFAAMEGLLNILLVQNWCRANNAKFIFCSAFDDSIYREWFKWTLLGTPYSKVVDTVDWECFMTFKAFDTCGQYLASVEGAIEYTQKNFFYNYAYSYKEGSPNGMFTPCAHPSVEGNYEVAKVIYDFIKERHYIPGMFNEK